MVIQHSPILISPSRYIELLNPHRDLTPHPLLASGRGVVASLEVTLLSPTSYPDAEDRICCVKARRILVLYSSFLSSSSRPGRTWLEVAQEYRSKRNHAGCDSSSVDDGQHLGGGILHPMARRSMGGATDNDPVGPEDNDDVELPPNL
jgi:hypothetical protein